MPRYEYKVVPAPRKGVKARGVRSTEDRFALALQKVMNDLGANGWEYQRTDTLPCEERSGFTGKTTGYQNMLVFRRENAVPATGETATATPSVVLNAENRVEADDHDTKLPSERFDDDDTVAQEPEVAFRTTNRDDANEQNNAPGLPGQRRADDNATQ